MDKREQRKAEFVRICSELYNNKYNYDKADYIDIKTKICIICPVHGEFMQKPDAHRHGHGCPECAKEKRAENNRKRGAESIDKRKQDFIDKANVVHNNRYGYSKVEYKDNRTKVCIICPFHGEFLQMPFNHLRGQICPECDREAHSLDYDEFIRRAKAVHGDRYEYDGNSYVSTKIKMRIRCSEHGWFEQIPEKHMIGQGCPKCSVKNMIQSKATNGTFNTSTSEENMYALLCDRFGSEDVKRQYHSDVYPYACDFYIVSRDMYIELNASWTHGRHAFTGSDADMAVLSEWREKASDSDYYANAIDVWAVKDVQKLQTAKNNNLNYLIFWDDELRDVVLWFSSGCPDGQLKITPIIVRCIQQQLADIILMYSISVRQSFGMRTQNIKGLICGYICIIIVLCI